VNNALGDALARIYVGRYFPASSKTRIQGMVVNIKAAFTSRIQALDWMAPRPRPKPSPRSRASSWASAIPIRGRIMRA
jgi:predicted metalloendopeptidase